MKNLIKVVVLIAVLLSAGQLKAQVTNDSSLFKFGENYVVVLHDGTEYIGELLADDGREVLIRTKMLGSIYIPKYQIREIKPISIETDVVHGELRTVGPFTTRYYFTNNAYPIVKGDNYALMHLYGPEVHFSLSNRFSLGVMSTWIASPIALAAKYSFSTENKKVNFSLGTIMGSSGYLFSARGYGGLHWFSATIGERGNNMTFSAGLAYVQTGIKNDEWDPVSLSMKEKQKPTVVAPMFSIAGITTVSAKASFIFDSMIALSHHSNTYYPNANWTYEYDSLGYIIKENYDPGTPVVDEGYRVSALVMPGMRFQKTDKRAFQIALAGVFEWDEAGFDNSGFGEGHFRSIPFPMCTWFFKF